MRVTVEWDFVCQASLPVEPKGRGHKQAVALGIVQGEDPRPEENEQRFLGKRGELCGTRNVGRSGFGKGVEVVKCVYCGAPAFTVMVLNYAKDEASSVLLLRDQAPYVKDLEVVRGAD